MTILIYDYNELEERASKHLRAWKVWHIILYVIAAIFGVLNYTFLFETERLVAQHCVFYPRELDFHWIKRTNADTNETITSISFDPGAGNVTNINYAQINVTTALPSINENSAKNVTKEDDAQINATTALPSNGNEKSKEEKVVHLSTTPPPAMEEKRDKREASPTVTAYTTTEEKLTVEEKNETIITKNTTHRLVLNPARTLFPQETDSRCQFAEYMPLLSAVFAIVWTTLFIMCPNGGRTRTGIREPWRILTPAFLFAFVMVILTGYSFTSTNGGLEAFCAAFQNYTNTTACSAVNPFINVSDDTTWTVGGRISATRAASAGVWASWICACAILLARCLAGADFVVRHTAVHLVRDPQKKITPYLEKQKSPRRSQRSTQNSPNKRDTTSVRSDPTVTTELVTASVEHEGLQDSQPTSLAMTPAKERQGEELEMTYNPHERRYQ